MSVDGLSVPAGNARPAPFGGLKGRLILLFSVLFITILALILITGFTGIPGTRYQGRQGEYRDQAFRILNFVADIEEGMAAELDFGTTFRCGGHFRKRVRQDVGGTVIGRLIPGWRPNPRRSTHGERVAGSPRLPSSRQVPAAVWHIAHHVQKYQHS
jgi:hypothetical protein